MVISLLFILILFLANLWIIYNYLVVVWLANFLFLSLNSGIWGYAPRFKELQKKILAVVPGANVKGAVGRECMYFSLKVSWQIV